MLPRIRPAILVAPLALAPTASAQFQVWTVDDDGPADFVSIQSAIDAAADHDVILVRGGDYAPFTIDGKGLSVLGDEGAQVRVLSALTPSSGVEVRNVGPGQRTVLRSMELVPGDQVVANFLRIDDCAGVVFVQDVFHTVPPSLPFLYQLSVAEAVEVTSSDHVVLVNVAIQGATGAAQGFGLESGTIGLDVLDSNVYAFESEFRGGATVVLGGTGRSGVRVVDGLFVARDSSIVGGNGGEAAVFGAPGPGPGGTGLSLSGTAQGWAINSQLVGGPGGGDFFGGTVGATGSPFLGPVVESAANEARFTSTIVVRDDAADDDVHFDLRTAPGSACFLITNFGTAPLFLPSFPEVIVAEFPPIVLPAGTSDANGDLSWSLGIPTLPPGFQTWDATAQAAVFTADPELEISSPTIFTVVDDAF